MEARKESSAQGKDFEELALLSGCDKCFPWVLALSSVKWARVYMSGQTGLKARLPSRETLSPDFLFFHPPHPQYLGLNPGRGLNLGSWACCMSTLLIQLNSQPCGFSLLPPFSSTRSAHPPPLPFLLRMKLRALYVVVSQTHLLPLNYTSVLSCVLFILCYICGGPK